MTQIIVHKYGGTSMGSVERIANVAKRVAKWYRAGYQLVVVPSAMSGETNRLIGLAHALSTQPNARELDQLTATGEQVSIGLLSIALEAQGIPAVSYCGWQVAVKTDNSHTKARIESIDNARITHSLNAGFVVIVAGFQGINQAGDITTLGRGGSDTSAVAMAAALQAKECLIFTDVDGVYTTDPRIVPEAKRMAKITFEEMLEMASLGSKVLQIRSVEFAGKYRVKTRVLSSLTDPNLPIDQEANSGTLITFEDEQNPLTMEQAVISGIAFSRDEAKITMIGVLDNPGIAYKILGPIAQANIDVDVIIQNQSMNGMTDFSFTVARGEYLKAMAVLNTQVKSAVGAREILGDDKVCKVSIVGIGMKSHVGVASTMFQTLAEEGINIQMISTSEIKTSVVIADKYMELAVRALHKAFGLNQNTDSVL